MKKTYKNNKKMSRKMKNFVYTKKIGNNLNEKSLS